VPIRSCARAFFLSLALTLALPLSLALPTPAAAADLCARGARVEAVPIDHLFAIDLFRMREKAWATVDWSDPAVNGEAFAYPESDALTRAFADWSASLPPALADLPYLILLSETETYPESALFTLTHAAESDMAARVLDAMDRAGLTTEAALLREAIALYPDWGSHPRDRSRQIYDSAGSIADQALFDALTDLSFRWPPPIGRAAAAAEALLALDPKIEARYRDRLARMTVDDRMDWLMQRLWSECLGYFDTPEEADRAFFSQGSVQGALLVLDGLALDLTEGGLDVYFYGYNGTMAPQAAALLARRGMDAEAAALREAMGLFGTPFPRDTPTRQGLIEGLDPAAFDRLIVLSAGITPSVVRAEMARLAQEAGLMPGG
jgi:hypothetical protein